MNALVTDHVLAVGFSSCPQIFRSKDSSDGLHEVILLVCIDHLALLILPLAPEIPYILHRNS